jgi:hypothetical protein
MKPLVILTLLLLYSCGSEDKNTPDEKNDFFINIYSSLLEFKDQHNKLMEKYAALMSKSDPNNARESDTAGGSVLLYNAKSAQSFAIKSISPIKEVDSAINLKLKSINYLSEARVFYDDFFNRVLQVSKTTQDPDSVLMLESVEKEVTILAVKDSICIEACKSYRNKYHIEVLQ